jgi:FkbM family methyltransferase
VVQSGFVFAICVFLGGLLVLGAALYRLPSLRFYIPFFPAMRILGLTAFGYNPLCPLIQAITGYNSSLRHRKIQSRLANYCRLVNKEAGLELWEAPGGRLWVPEGSGARHITYMLAEQELRIYSVSSQSVRPGEVVLDCGANIGVFTREALNAGAKQVIAIEPAAQNLECLRRNLASEISAGRVIICETGLWDEQCQLTLTIAPHDSGQNTFVEDPRDGYRGPQVAVTTIDRIMEELRLGKVDFIKMDIEGSEQRALIGAGNTLSRYAPRMAIAVEHTANPLENAKKVIQIVRQAQSAYVIGCGPCVVLKDRFVFPLVVHFQA